MTSAREVIELCGLEIDPTEFDPVTFRQMPPLLEAILSGRASAITLGRTVFVRAVDYEDVVSGKRPDLAAHELLHTVQWRDDGVAFLPRYLKEYLMFRLVGASHDAAYRSISYEIAAYNAGTANRRSPS